MLQETVALFGSHTLERSLSSVSATLVQLKGEAASPTIIRVNNGWLFSLLLPDPHICSLTANSVLDYGSNEIFKAEHSLYAGEVEGCLMSRKQKMSKFLSAPQYRELTMNCLPICPNHQVEAECMARRNSCKDSQPSLGFR